MSRPCKTGLDYFPMDTHLDDEFRALEEIHGNDGFTWIVKFWQAAYKTNDGIVDLSGIFGILSAKTCRISFEKQKEIINDSISLGLLIEVNVDKYTSNGIQKRLNKVNFEREKDRNYSKIELSERKPSENTQIRGDSKVKESKVKESKVKEIERKEYNIIPPTTDMISKYCIERKNGIDSKRFFDYYESRGWLIGKNKMKNWQAAIRTWENNNTKTDRIKLSQIPISELYK
jgi:hypothetical protein